MALDSVAARTWFDTYLGTFAASVRGEQDMAALLQSYAVPLLITTDDGVVPLSTAEQVAVAIQGQVDGLRAQRFHHSVLLHADISVVNATTALVRAALARYDGAGSELDTPVITYLLVHRPDGVQIAVLAPHG